MGQEAIELFSTISNPDEINLVLLLRSCAQVGTPQALHTGRQVLADMPADPRKNTFILNTALDMFIQCGDVSSAENWFSNMECNVINYGQMMKCFNKEKLPLKTLNLYQQMKNKDIQADAVTFLLLIDACSLLGMESICQSIVEQIPPAVLVNPHVKNALIDMWVTELRGTRDDPVPSRPVPSRPVPSRPVPSRSGTGR